MPTPTWRLARFDQLALGDLYAILQLRQRVFVLEQNCPFLDADGADDRAWHLMGWTEDVAGGPQLGAYARLFAPGAMYAEASIGRVVTHPEVRRGGMGRALMRRAIDEVAVLAPGSAVRIGAQRYLERFYAGFGFVAEGDGYLEDGIPHVEMVLRAGVADAPTG
jgi:ElaA protein